MRPEQLVLGTDARNVVKAFRSVKPWQGTFAERLAKFETFGRDFAAAAGLTVKFAFVGEEAPGRPGNGGYDPDGNRVILVGKLSVVTLLFAYGLAAGLDRTAALEWARGLFAHFFPRSYRRCRLVSGRLVIDPRA